MKPTKKLTEAEMDVLVIADADDDSAWGDPVEVPASKSPRPAWIAEAKRTNVAIIAPDLAEFFPDSDAVNEALRTLVRLFGQGDRLSKSAKSGA